MIYVIIKKVASGLENHLCPTIFSKNILALFIKNIFMKKIILILLSALIIISAFRRKEIIITGKITTENGKSIPYVTITAGNKSATADANGAYKITIDERQKYFVATAVGYITQKIKINSRSVINIQMKTSGVALNEVVVTAFGQSKSTNFSRDSKMMNLSTPRGYTKNKSANDEYNTEEYSNIAENGFHKVTDDPLSTFSIDVDAASYANVRRYLNSNQLPPAGAVRTEEMINYFKYQYPQPTGKDPFSINTEISDCPWNNGNKLLLIGLQGKNIPVENLPASNLVFLIDVSGSMMDETKLPLVKASMKMLTDQLREKDHIAIVTYAGNAGLALSSVNGSNKIKIKTAIDALEAGGSTAGGAGIQLAYKIARQNFMRDGNNRIILCTDGDFNIGASSDDEMVRLIEQERDNGIYISVLGFGMGNYKDSKMEQIADKGNGNYAYIDGISEAKKVLVNEFGGTLFTIAKDVKIQLEFNPSKLQAIALLVMKTAF